MVVRFPIKSCLKQPVFGIKAHLSLTFLVIAWVKNGLVSWVGEADANEGKLEKIKNNIGEPWTVTDEINANTLINFLVVTKAKSAVTIYKKFAF